MSTRPKKKSNLSVSLNNLLLLFFAVILAGCAHNKELQYADYHNSLSSGITFYSQYYSQDNKGRVRVVPHLNDVEIPKDVKELNLIVSISNPNNVDYVIWSIQEWNFEDRVYRMTEKVNESNAVTDAIKINLPLEFKQSSKIKFNIDVYAKTRGTVLYKSKTITYRITL